MTTLIQRRHWKQCFFIDIWQFGLEIMELFTVSIVGACMNPHDTRFIFDIALAGQNPKFSRALQNIIDKEQEKQF
jgi:hypothetical protein